MSAPNTCPQCGAPLKAKTIGSLHDKFLVCEHCGYQIDVLDEYETKQSEKTEKPDGTKKTVEVSYRRRDLSPGDIDRDDTANLIKEKYENWEDIPEGEATLVKKNLPDGTEVIEIVKDGGVILDETEDMSKIKKILGEHFDLDELKKFDLEGDLPEGKDGVEHVFEKVKTFEATETNVLPDLERTLEFSTMDANGKTMANVKFILFLAGFLALLFFFMMLLFSC